MNILPDLFNIFSTIIIIRPIVPVLHMNCSWKFYMSIITWPQSHFCSHYKEGMRKLCALNLSSLFSNFKLPYKAWINCVHMTSHGVGTFFNPDMFSFLYQNFYSFLYCHLLSLLTCLYIFNWNEFKVVRSRDQLLTAITLSWFMSLIISYVLYTGTKTRDSKIRRHLLNANRHLSQSPGMSETNSPSRVQPVV